MDPVSALRQFLAGLRLLLLFTVILGLAYPLAITAAAQLAAPGRADGSQLSAGGKVIGSSLIGQPFDEPQWFHPRPSAAGEGYDTLSSSGSNLGPNNADLVTAIRERRDAYAATNGVAPEAVPVDALTASGSGLDPHISPRNARLQAPRVARARGLAPADVQALIEQQTQGRTLGVLGEQRVNVLELNLALTRAGRDG